MKTVAEVMTTGVVTIGADTTVADAAALMLDRGLDLLPVVEGERLVGVVTPLELLRAPPYRPIASVMRRDVSAVSNGMPVTSAYALLEARGAGRLPVVEDDRVVGLVSTEAILRALGLPIDPLTELPWAVALRHRAVELLKEGREIAILFFDLDNFGQVNKRLGHVAGDRWIRGVAETLRDALDPAYDLLCRYAGDEFAILTTRARDDAEAFGRQALEAIGALRLESLPDEVAVSASMGLAGGKRTTERHDVHFEATVDSLVTFASRQSTQAKADKEAGGRIAADLAAPRGLRLQLRGVNVSWADGVLMAAVTLSLGADRFHGEASGASATVPPWPVLAEATVRAVNQALSEGWQVGVDDVRVIGTGAGYLVTVTTRLGQVGKAPERHVGAVLADVDVGQAVVRATLHALNRRAGVLFGRAQPKGDREPVR